MGDNRHGGHGGGHHGGHGGGNHHGGHHGGHHNNGHGGGHGGGDKPTDLGQKVDWMTYSHQQLWEMVNTGVDLKAAGSAQADWATVGKALGEVQELLAKAIGQSAQAWEGGTADRAREALESVEKWALNTSEHADNVAKCIATEIEHVQTAREMMPPPAPAPPVVTPVDGAVATPVPTPVAGPTPVATTRSPFANQLAEPAGFDSLTPSEQVADPRLGGARGAFTGIDTIAAPAVGSVTAADATHRQAAEVMALFQQNSYAVDRTVPSFAPPVNPVAPPPPSPVVVTGGPTTPSTVDGNGHGGPVVVNNQQQRQQGNQQPRPGGAQPPFGRGGFAGGRGGYGGGRGGGVPTPIGAVGGGGGGGAGTPLSAPGTASGALGDRGGSGGGNPGSVTSTFQAPKSVTPQAGMIGAAPMAAPPPIAGGGGGERDHNRPNYLEDDDNVFGLDNKAAPPVIGL